MPRGMKIVGVQGNTGGLQIRSNHRGRVVFPPGSGPGASTTGASATGRGASLSLGASTIEFRSSTTAASPRACNSPPTASRASSPTRSPTTRGIQSATSSQSASPGSRTTLTHRGRGHAAKLVLTALGSRLFSLRICLVPRGSSDPAVRRGSPDPAVWPTEGLQVTRRRPGTGRPSVVEDRRVRRSLPEPAFEVPGSSRAWLWGPTDARENLKKLRHQCACPRLLPLSNGRYR